MHLRTVFCRPTAAKEREAMRGQARSEFQGTILIADDHEVFRLGLVPLLRRGLRAKRIAQAEGFEEAVERLKAGDVTLAIVDLGMPDLKGPADLARMRLLCPEARVVVLSGSQSARDILEALGAGVHGYIVKTERPEELVGRLRYILSGEIYVPPILAELVSEPAPGVTPSGGASLAGKTLSSRQRQVLKCLVEGKSNKQIAQELEVAQGTVKMHLATIYKVLGATNRAHAAALGKQLFG
jgi:DNA-binding NarL/FixJ family response regulator